MDISSGTVSCWRMQILKFWKWFLEMVSSHCSKAQLCFFPTHCPGGADFLLSKPSPGHLEEYHWNTLHFFMLRRGLLQNSWLESSLNIQFSQWFGMKPNVKVLKSFVRAGSGQDPFWRAHKQIWHGISERLYSTEKPSVRGERSFGSPLPHFNKEPDAVQAGSWPGMDCLLGMFTLQRVKNLKFSLLAERAAQNQRVYCICQVLVRFCPPRQWFWMDHVNSYCQTQGRGIQGELFRFAVSALAVCKLKSVREVSPWSRTAMINGSNSACQGGGKSGQSFPDVSAGMGEEWRKNHLPCSHCCNQIYW